VDLGEAAVVDAVRLLPAKRPTSDLPSGFGFPRKLLISVAETSGLGDQHKGAIVAERALRNPGHNPVVLPFDARRGRFVRIEAVELWKAFESYPAFFALSEVEVLAGDKNLAQGKVVRSPDGMPNIFATGGRYWSSAALTDGFGPDGRLVSTREWLTQLDRRLQLETRLHELRVETGLVVSHWRRAGLTGLTVLGLAGAFLIIALPIRYRIHAHRELLKVRERIAGDLHDEVGSNLGSIQMFADLAEGRSGPSDDLKRIQRIAAETVSAVRDIVWLLRPQGEHRIGTLEHLRETSSIMLETLEWKFTADEAAWQVELAEEATRHLFLFFREALHNIMRHARASKVDIRVEAPDAQFRLSISDDGVGIAPERLERPATLHALRQRAEALGAQLGIESQPGAGTRLSLVVPLPRKHRRKARSSPLAVDRA
jgi:signal transduction histidine kinase